MMSWKCTVAAKILGSIALITNIFKKKSITLERILTINSIEKPL